jgi:hypothetical protein
MTKNMAHRFVLGKQSTVSSLRRLNGLVHHLILLGVDKKSLMTGISFSLADDSEDDVAHLGFVSTTWRHQTPHCMPGVLFGNAGSTRPTRRLGI